MLSLGLRKKIRCRKTWLRKCQTSGHQLNFLARSLGCATVSEERGLKSPEMNNFQQQTFAARPGYQPQGMMGGPGISHMQQLQNQRMMGNAQQQQGMMGAQLARMGQQGMMGGPQHRMAGPSVHPQGMMGAQQHRMGMPGVSQQGMMGAQHPRMVSPVVSQQGIMGAHPRMASPMVSQQGMMGAHPRMVSPVVNQQGMMGNQMLRPGMSQQSMMGTAQPRMLGATAQSLGMDPRVNQQLMMQRQQQRMMGPAVSQQSMMGMQQQRMMGINQQRSVGPGQMQQGMMGAQPHVPSLPQQSMMGTTDGSHLGAQQQRIMVTILPEHGAVGPSSQRIVESTHGISERQVIEIKTSGDALIDSQWEKQNGATRSNNVNIVISPQEDLPRYDAPSSTANTVSPRASTLRTLVEVPLSFDTGVSEKQMYTKDVDHRLLKPDLDPGILKDGDVDYRTLVPIRPAEEEDPNILETTPDKPSSTKDIPLKLLVKLKPLKPLQKAQPPVETSKAEPKTDPENSSPTKDSKDPPKPGLVPVPSKGSANKSKITLKLIDRTAKQKRTEEDVTYGGIPALLENSVQRLSLSMEPTQQEILSALEEDCGCMNLFSPQVEQTTTDRTEMSDKKPIRLLSLSELSAEDKKATVQEIVETKVCPSHREEEFDISSSPEVFGVLSVPATEPEMVATSTEPDHLFSSDSKSGETPTELSENHNVEQTQDESEDNLRENLPFQTHSKGPLKSFPLASQDKEERQARDDELIQTSLDAMVEPSEVQNIAISFKNPIAEAFEPNKPGSPLLSLALKLTRLHKRNVAKSYNGKHLRRTISVIEEGMENRNTGVKEKNKAGKELRLVISRVFTTSGESGPELTQCPTTKMVSQASQDRRTVIVSEEAAEKEDATLPTTFQDTGEQTVTDCENNFTSLNNNLSEAKEEREHSQIDNTMKYSTSPKRKAISDEDHSLPRKVTRSNSIAMYSNAKPGTDHVKQGGETIKSLCDSSQQITRNLFHTFLRSTNSPKDLQSRNSNNNNRHSAITGGVSNLMLKVHSTSSSNSYAMATDKPETSTQNSQASMSGSTEGSKIKDQCNNLDKLVANNKKDCTKSLLTMDKPRPDHNFKGDSRFNKEPTANFPAVSNCNNCDLPGKMSQENCTRKKSSEEETLERKSQYQAAEDGRLSNCGSFSGSKVKATTSNKNLHATSQSNQKLYVPNLNSEGIKRVPDFDVSHVDIGASSGPGTATVGRMESTRFQPNSAPNCPNLSKRIDPRNTESRTYHVQNSMKSASQSGALRTENGARHAISVTLNLSKVENSSQLPTKTVQNLSKGCHQTSFSSQSQSIPVLLGRESPQSQTTKTVDSPHAQTLPYELQEKYSQQNKSPLTQGKFFRVCQPPNKFSEGSMEANALQEQSQNGVQGEIQVEETTSSDVRKVTFSEADYSQEDPSTWPQGISLQAMKHVVLVDLGCWPQFFQSLPKSHLEDTFVWGFQDAKTSWRPPVSCDEYCRLSRKRHFFLHPPCGSVDSAICMVAGKLDSYLPRHLPFTLLPGPPGFAQLQQRWKKCRREGNLINPNTTDLQNILQHLFSTEDSSASTS
ncbi:serine-rich adhesin for platelets-like [Branchiostoma lanceolatum]|uniref:serine-rich adhesin for platelets-like n=1 Tax=Branchiostoma lanceolatum TaxID=7740 RepID=UPI003454B3AE